MKTQIAIAVRKPDRTGQKILAGWLKLVKDPTVQLVAGFFLAGVLGLWWQGVRLQRQLVESTALDQARAYAQALKELGGAYTSEGGARGKSNFSALLAKLSNAEGKKTDGVTGRFYSMEPAGSQAKGGEAPSVFARQAWLSLAKNPGQFLSQFEEIQGQPVLRYATGWQEGDARGVLEIVLPLNSLLMQVKSYRTTLFVLFSGLSIIGACLVAMVLKKIRRDARESELRSLALESEFTEQEKIIRAYERGLAERQQQEESILTATEVLATVADDLLKATNELASSATEMAAAVNETTTTVEEVKRTAALSSQKAQQVSATAQKAAQISQVGKQATEDTIAEMQRIRDQMQSIADSIMKLSEQSQVIREIIDTVNDLAEQSNLLAVNASIEAQKAGVHGGGFVVVAQEVRSLAQQSKDATLQVQTILNEIERATSAAVQITAQGARAAEAGMKQSVEAGEAIRTLAQSVQEAAQSATLIATSNQQQAIGMDQVVQAMHNIQEGSRQTVTSTRQVESCVQRLQKLEQQLADLSEHLTGVKPARALRGQASLAEAA
jgi:methyl-accepting chemotaxis protein